MRVRKGDKVELMFYSYGHARAEKNKSIPKELLVISADSEVDAFVVEGGFLYCVSDVYEVYTKEENPEYFL